MAQRHLRNTCLEYLVETGKQTHINRALEQFEHGGNMTNVIAALKALSNFNCEERQKALASFEATWSNDPLVLDKWFSIQATSRLAETPERVIALMNHSGFDIKNPNRVRALLGAFFMMNLAYFHASDGAGYAFFSRQVLALDALNPQVAARMMGAIIRWRRYDSHRQTLMKVEIEKIIDTESISRDVYELAAKSLDK
jgi:aminopeptidase N